MGKKLKELKAEIGKLRKDVDQLWKTLKGKPAKKPKPKKPAKKSSHKPATSPVKKSAPRHVPLRAPSVSIPQDTSSIADN